MKRQGFLKGIGMRLAALFLTALSLITMVLPKPQAEIAFADSLSISLDTTSVMDDLGSTIDLSKYPAVAGAEPKLYSFMEYCYSPNAFRRENYALYIYVYNPSQTEYSEFTGVSVANMAFKYKTDEKGDFVLNDENELTAVDYRNFPLKNCGYTQGGSVDKLFYKFRVMGVEDILNNVVKMDEAGMERRYDLVGLQLFTKGADLAEDYDVGQEIYYKGYAEGYGNSLDSTLSSRWEKGDFIELNVEHTFYRTMTSSLGNGHQNQLDTVYFQVPETLFENYGTLQRIKAEWWEYKTREVAVTSHAKFHNEAIEHIGEIFDYNDPDDGEYGLVDNYHYVKTGILPSDLDGYWAADWKWRFYGPLTAKEDFCEALYYLFFTKYGYDISNYDPYADIEEIGGVSSDVLTKYIKNYNTTFRNGTLPIKEGTISADLFEDDIDESRKMDNERGKIQKGYSYYDFDLSLDLQEWESWSDRDASFWEEVEGGYWEGVGDNKLLFSNLYYLLKNSNNDIPEEEGRSLSPIYEVREEDLQGSPAEISERLCVQYSDVERIKKAYDEAVTVSGANDEKKRLILFRFAVSDYYSQEVDIVSAGTGMLGTKEFIEDQAYIFQQSVFLDFDVIQLTFNKDGNYTVIPVVADPIDIINAGTPPVREDGGGGCNGCANFDFGRIFAGIIVFLVVVILIKWYTKIRGWWRDEQIYKNTKNNKRGGRKR